MKSGKGKATGFPVRAFVIGIILCVLFAWGTVLRDNKLGTEEYPSANLIPAMPYVMLIAAGLLVNPLLKRFKVARTFSKSELLLIFVMTAVSIGTATFGLCGWLVPKISGLSNRAWNTDQSEWDAYVMPFRHEDYYISEAGTQAAALELHRADREYEEAKAQYRVARDLVEARAELVRIEDDMAQIAAIADPVERAEKEEALEWPRSRATRLLELATEEWAEMEQDHDPQVVVDTYEAKIDQFRERRDQLRAELKELNKEAFDEVDIIRKGLPEDQRAMPGFLIAPGEGFVSLRARIKRLRVGLRVLERIEAADETLAQSISSATALPPGWPGRIEDAAGSLEEIAHIRPLEELEQRLAAEASDLNTRMADEKSELRRLRQLRRYAEQGQFEMYDARVKDLEKSTKNLEEKAKDLKTRLDKQIRPQLKVCDRVVGTQEALRRLAQDARAAGVGGYGDLRDRLLAQKLAFAEFGASHRRFWLGDGRWGVWLKPLFNWFVLVLIGYMVFMSFNTLIYRQWAYNEKLIYPIAEITTLLAGSGDEASGQKSIFKNGLFWLGFAIALGILGWNFVAAKKLVPGLNPVKLQVLWLDYVGGVFKGLGSTYFCIIFAVIGLSFLVPSGISFSLWFFEFLYLGLLLVMSWMGYGYNRWSMGNPARGELGRGAAVVFGLMVLWTCRKYLLSAIRPSGLKGLASDERKELRISSALFLVSSLALILMVVFRFGANPVHAVLSYLVAILCTIVLMRAVTEGGVLSMEVSFTLTGIAAIVFGTDRPWARVAGLGLVGTVMFGGVKAFIASAMANAFKMRDSISERRLTFHAAVWTGILVTILTATVALIILSYDRGANSLDGWMHTAMGKAAGPELKSTAWGVGKAVVPAKRNWFFVGIILMIGLLLARQKFFGVPHPLGLVMLMNPVMFGFWGSILIGWLCKSLVSKYCTKEQYAAIRGFFVGLVVGHLTAVLLGWERMRWHWG